MAEYSTRQNEALGESEVFLNFQDKLSKAAAVDRPIMVIGERGSGKELAASRLHYLSQRWEGPFVALNCSALTPGLIETELFGHEQGAYTGASGRRKGRFEEAHRGTLFLDEIGLIPLEVQEKILRVVEYGSFERVGSSLPIEVDVRIICATNADLPSLCDEGKFKRDLLDRLSFEVLFLPPLRFRGKDIMYLATFFANRMSMELQINDTISFSPEVEAQLIKYRWPGNVRELKNVVERAVYSSKSAIIESLVIDPYINPYSDEKVESKSNNSYEVTNLKEYKQSLIDLELSYVKEALIQSQYNQKLAADLLDLTYDQFRGLYRKYKDQLA